MKPKDLLRALVVVIIWGVNFTVIKLGLGQVPPMLLVAFRFMFAAFPAILFVKKPTIGWKYIIAYGATVGIGQFSCLFYAIYSGMPAGISSVILQSQAFFTLFFAAVLAKESIRRNQMIGLCISGGGLIAIGFTVYQSSEAGIPMKAFFLTLLAAAFWGLSNVVAKLASNQAQKQEKKLDMFALVVWSSLIPPIPVLGLAFYLDSPETIRQSITSINALSIAAICYLAFLSTLVGYGLWSTLLSKYPAGKIAPLSLLVPVIGLITAQIVLKEHLTPVQWVAGGVVLLGIIYINLAGKKKGE